MWAVLRGLRCVGFADSIGLLMLLEMVVAAAMARALLWPLVVSAIAKSFVVVLEEKSPGWSFVVVVIRYPLPLLLSAVVMPLFFDGDDCLHSSNRLLVVVYNVFFVAVVENVVVKDQVNVRIRTEPATSGSFTP
jgi:hypothetical protein